MCSIAEFLAVFDPDTGPIERGSIWHDRDYKRVQVIYSDREKVQVIRDIDFKRSSGKYGSPKYAEFSLDFFLHIFYPVIR